MTTRDRARGCLLGLACGDAMGRPLEFKSADHIDTQYGDVTEMLAHGTHGQPAGTVTDDTEMALCIAESLVARGGFDPADVAERFSDWLDSGPFDIGLMTRDALRRIQRGAAWHEAGLSVWQERPEGSNAGNGSVMRCAPYAIAFRNSPATVTRVSRLSSAITHADPRCQWGCVILNRTLSNLLQEQSDPLAAALAETDAAPDKIRAACQRVQDVLQEDATATNFEEVLNNSGYVVDSLQAALYYGLSAPSVEAAIVQAVNAGNDTDTVGAITGAVAGARFGAQNVPERWKRTVSVADRIVELADQLADMDDPVVHTERQPPEVQL